MVGPLSAHTPIGLDRVRGWPQQVARCPSVTFEPVHQSCSELKQEPLYQRQADLRYQLTPIVASCAGVSQTCVDDERNDDEARPRKFRVDSCYFVSPRTQLIVSVGLDLKVEIEWKENARLNPCCKPSDCSCSAAL